MNEQVREALRVAGEKLRALPKEELEARLNKGTPKVFEEMVRLSDNVGYPFELFWGEYFSINADMGDVSYSDEACYLAYLQPGTTALAYYSFQFRLGEGGKITVIW
jgi:hypothetical protein